MIKLLSVVTLALRDRPAGSCGRHDVLGILTIHSWYGLPPEQHVIEVVQPPYSGNFIMNGSRFTGQMMACLRWAAGERIRLIAGDWNGRCIDAVFYNVCRRSTLRDVVPL